MEWEKKEEKGGGGEILEREKTIQWKNCKVALRCFQKRDVREEH